MKKNYLKTLCATVLATVLVLSNSLYVLAETPTGTSVSGGDPYGVAAVSDGDAGTTTTWHGLLSQMQRGIMT